MERIFSLLQKLFPCVEARRPRASAREWVCACGDKAAKSAAIAILVTHILACSANSADARRAALQDQGTSPVWLGSITEYTWHVTVRSQAPDCFQRDVMLVNGTFQPTLEVTQGNFLKVTFIAYSIT